MILNFIFKFYLIVDGISGVTVRRIILRILSGHISFLQDPDTWVDRWVLTSSNYSSN